MATSKQEKYAIKLLENNGNKYRSAIAAGYSHNTAKNATPLIEERKGFQELMAEKIPELELIDIIKKGLHAEKVVLYNRKKYSQPDWPSRHKFADTILEVSGHKRSINNSLLQFNQWNS